MKDTFKIMLRGMMVAGVCVSLVACGGSKSSDETDEKPQEAADVLYMKGREEFAKNNFLDAIDFFDEVERQHPYSEWAPRSQVMTAYAHYQSEQYEDAVLSLERFVKLHPGHESVAYAYYMKSLCFYEQISDVGRDQGMTEQAMLSLREVVSRFPRSDYARDAKLKLDLTEDHLAGKEMMVGRYYLTRDDYIASINRFKMVLDRYQTTGHAAEALHRLVESYLSLGVVDEAKRYASVLGHNFPNSEWYGHSYDLLKGEVPAQPANVKPIVPAAESAPNKALEEAASSNTDNLVESGARELQEAEKRAVQSIMDAAASQGDE